MDSKDVELRVRARDYSQKTLDGVTASLQGMLKAQEAQIAASKRGEVSTAQLEAGYRKIESALQALSKQGALTKVFESQSKALAEVTTRLEKARQAQTEFKNSLSGSEKLTADQVKQQRALAREVSNAEKAQTNARDRLDSTVKSLERYGVAADKVVGAQKRIKDSIADGNRALAAQEKAIDGNAGSLAEKANRDRAAAEQLVTEAMRRSGQQAEATARGYQTLARSVQSVRGNDLGKQLEAINNPAKVAVSNLGSLGDVLGKLEQRVKSVNGPVKQYRQTMAELEQAQRGNAAIGAQIDGYRRQMDAVRMARTEYATARQELLSLTTQMKAAGADSGNFASQVGRAQAVLKQAAQAMSAQVSSARQLREALRTAGVDTRNLAQAEQQIIKNARQATSAVESLSAAYQKNGAAAEGAGKKTFKFFGGDRTTLSYAQRLRGEILALTTAYVGLQGGLNLAGGALDAFKKKQQIMSTLTAFTGNEGDAKKEFNYVVEQADRIGFAVEKSAQAYAKMGIAAKSAGLDTQATRYIFEQFAQAARVAGQSNVEFEGTLKAVEQMMSKGKIQAEELRGQLGDRLAGAFTIAAQAIGVTSAQLDKMMENGEVSSDFLIQIAEQLGKTYTGADKAAQSLAAAEARFANAIFKFKTTLAEKGFAEAYTDFINKLSALLSSDDGQRLAESLSKGFTAVIDVLKWTANNLDLVTAALKIMLGLAVVQWAVGAAGAVARFVVVIASLIRAAGAAITVMRITASTTAAAGAAAAGAAGSVGVFGGALIALGRAIPVLGALAIAIGAVTAAWNYMSDARETARRKEKEDALHAAGGGAVVGRVNGPAVSSNDPTMRQQVLDFNARMNRAGAAGTAKPADKVTADEISLQKELEKAQAKIEKDGNDARLKGAKRNLAERKKLIDAHYDNLAFRANKDIKDETKRSDALKKISEQRLQALAVDEAKFATQGGGGGGGGGGKSRAEKEAESRIKLAERVRDELKRIEDDLANEEVKSDASAPFQDRLSAKLDSVSHKYDKLKRDIAQLAKLDAEGAKAAQEKLDTYVKQLQTVEGVKLTQEEVKRLEDELADQQKLRSSLLDEEKAKYDAGLVSQAEFLANSNEIRNKMQGAISGAADNLQTFVDTAVKARSGLLSLTQQSEIRNTVSTARLGADSSRANAEAETKAMEDAISRLVDTRSAAEAVFKAQFDARMITEDEYAKRVNEHAMQYKENVLSQIELLLQRTEAQRAEGLLSGTLNEERKAQLDQLILKYQQLGVSIKGAGLQADTLGKYTQEFLNKGLDNALNNVADALTQMAQGQISVGEGFQKMMTASLQFFAQFMMDIAKAIIKQQILNALASMGGAWGQAAAAVGGVASRNHTGGVIGAANGAKREVNNAWFINAPRFHDGGIPGLRSDEVPSILQTGEEVLARNDPRNVLNGGGGAGGGAGTRVVLVDDRSKVAEAMQSAEGEHVIVQTVRRNASTIKRFMGA